MSAPPFLPPVPRPLHPKGWSRPATSTEFRVTQMYADVNPAISNAIHGGMDMGNGHLGAELYAPALGVVIAEGWLLQPWSQASTRWPPAPNYGGVMVVIDHGTGYISALAHMERTTVNKGQTVTAGQQVGNLGATGAAKEFGGHVHWDLYRVMQAGESSGPLRPITYAGKQWRKVDPWPLLVQNWTVPDTSIPAPKEDTMRFGGAQLHVVPGVPVFRFTENAHFRAGPARDQASLQVIPAGTVAPLAYFVNGEMIGTNDEWALLFLYVNGAYTSGLTHTSVLARAEGPAPGPTADEVAALVKQGRKAGAQGAADAAAAYARAQ
jgi:hypothetical protein